MDELQNSDNDLNIDDTIEDEEDGITLTAAEVLALVQEQWLNEKFAPEILPQKSEILECLFNQINFMEENLKNVQLDVSDFRRALHQFEVERLRFLATSYLRTRLEKIELFAFAILNEDPQGELMRSYLTPEELLFARNYKENIEQHFENVLSFWPGLPPNDWKKEIIVPNLHSFVFLKSKENIEGVVIDEPNEDGDLVDLKAGSQMIISYNSISNLLKNGDVHLI